jgi:hypothetical protein
MAKATANCKCVECGVSFEKTTVKSNRKEANSWEQWAESYYDKCPQCWGKEQRKKEQETPLTLNVSINPYSINTPIILTFTGNTMEVKDSIKALGYYWADTPTTGFLGILGTNKSVKCWNKVISLERLEEELKKAEGIGANIINKVTEADIVAYKQVKARQDAKNQEKQEKLAQIKKPERPNALEGVIKWYGKIYGKSGSYCFYNNGEKANITDEQKEKIEQYLKEKEEYKKAVTEIEKEYR